MRKIREVLRLRHAHHQTTRAIGVSCSMGRSTVSEYLQRAQDAGLSWPLPAVRQLLPPSVTEVGDDPYPSEDSARGGVVPSLSSGEYLVKIEADVLVETGQIILLKPEECYATQ